MAGDPHRRSLKTLKPSEVDRWERYEQVDPFGSESWYLAIIAAWIFNGTFVSDDNEPISPEDVHALVRHLRSGIEDQREEATQQQVNERLMRLGDILMGRT